MNESTRKSLEILKKTLQNERISAFKNDTLFEEYRTNSEVQSDMEEICEIFNLHIYDYSGEGLFISPGVDNSTFGFSNAELKKALKADNDKELSLSLFIMYSIFSFIYKESTTMKGRDFITYQDAMECCEKKIQLIENHVENLQDDDEDIDISFTTLVKSWREKSDINLKSKAQNPTNDFTSQSKTAYVNRVLRFFCDNNLLCRDEHQNVYVVQPRLCAIVGYYYDEVTNRNAITEYLESVTI